MPLQPTTGEDLSSPVGESSDHLLLRRFREGSQDAATRLYLRYARRLNALVERQCSAELAHRVDIEDIVQSVFGSFFRGVRQGDYDVPDGDELWKLLLVIALHKIRDKADYIHAAKRDAHRTFDGEAARRCLESRGVARDAKLAFLELAFDESLEQLPPESRALVQLRIEGYDVAELAARTGRSRRTVERILQEARQKLDRLLRRED